MHPLEGIIAIPPCMKTQPYPHQLLALRWMLSREGEAVSQAEEQRFSSCNETMHPLFVHPNDNPNFFFAPYTFYMTITPMLNAIQRNGGVLCDMMGLGKTYEMLTLIALHPRGMTPQEEEGSFEVLKEMMEKVKVEREKEEKEREKMEMERVKSLKRYVPVKRKSAKRRKKGKRGRKAVVKVGARDAKSGSVNGVNGVNGVSGVGGVNGMNGMSGVGGMSGVNGVSGGVKEETNGGDVKWMGQEQLELVPNENKEEVNGGVKEEMNEGVEEETTGSVREEGMESEQNETVQTRKQDDEGINPETDQQIEESTTQEQNTPPTLPLLTPQETVFVQFIWDHLHLAVCDWALAVEKATQPRALDEELSALVDADDAWEMQEAAKESVPGYDSAALNVKPCFLPVSSSTVCARDGHFLVSSSLLVFCACFTRTIDYSHGRLIRCSHCRRYQHYSCTLYPHSSSSTVAAAKTASSTPLRTRATIAARRPSTCPNAFAPKARWC